MARNKKVYQSSTESFTTNIADFAVDSDVNSNKCARTKYENSHYSWFAVDLENVYQITKVCLLNTNSGCL